ncbi:polysaccharide pyruvyl transferase family protein [Lapidilactobacillus mulanensis]|uniref:Polysaccharide pyruvyl transferase family protein n=1 Tax=Lapidilactobacillus mulanensis TaxID=2485999 RepID=A0ABW4DQG9_9LACO|nr:polysaccharide pyruvyl transferase family protein [Lapidilactobacillus mulanensis]
MKKIGVVTLPGNFNYGNRLQNYALNQALVEMGNDVQNIVLSPNTKQRKPTPKKIVASIINRLSAENRQYHRMIKEKSPILSPFTEKYLRPQKIELVDLKSFDAFFVGSDQVWNPNYIKNDSRYFLDFVPKSKRFSYAASFGVSEITGQYKQFYKKSLEGINRISVRETQGVEIIKSLTDIRATIVADPTLLLTPAQWNVFANKSNFMPDEDYIIVYILGNLTQESNNEINEYAKQKTAKIITIMGDKYNSDYWIPSPTTFLAAIRGAIAVFTDSFHCTVFSIVFSTPFIVFDRTDFKMISRIDTLLLCFKLENNKFCSGHNFNQTLSNTIFDEVPKIMAREKANGENFIKTCLEDIY